MVFSQIGWMEMNDFINDQQSKLFVFVQAALSTKSLSVCSNPMIGDCVKFLYFNQLLLFFNLNRSSCKRTPFFADQHRTSSMNCFDDTFAVSVQIVPESGRIFARFKLHIQTRKDGRTTFCHFWQLIQCWYHWKSLVRLIRQSMNGWAYVEHERGGSIAGQIFSFGHKMTLFFGSIDNQVIVMRRVVSTHSVVGHLHQLTVRQCHVGRQLCGRTDASIDSFDKLVLIRRKPRGLARSRVRDLVFFRSFGLHFGSLQLNSIMTNWSEFETDADESNRLMLTLGAARLRIISDSRSVSKSWNMAMNGCWWNTSTLTGCNFNQALPWSDK